MMMMIKIVIWMIINIEMIKIFQAMFSVILIIY